MYLYKNTPPAMMGQYIQLSTTPVKYVTRNMPPSKETWNFIEHIEWHGVGSGWAGLVSVKRIRNRRKRYTGKQLCYANLFNANYEKAGFRRAGLATGGGT